MKLTAWTSDIERAMEGGSIEEMREMLRRLHGEIQALREAERSPFEDPSWTFVHGHFTEILESVGLRSGRIAEIGGRHNSFRAEMPDYDFEFLSLYPDPEDPAVRIADITFCPQVPDESFDVVFSKAVMEHVARPWAAAREIRRILKPGGVVYHAAPFSYFYHGAPEDFWRFTPEAFKQLFDDFEHLHASFYSQGRRMNNQGSEANPIDKDGGAQFSVDAFGGWRENWTTLYAGRKTPEAAAAFRRRRREQLAIDAVKMLEEDGVAEAVLFERAADVVARVAFDAEGDLRIRPKPAQRMDPARVRSLWRQKRRLGMRPSANRAALRALLGN